MSHTEYKTSISDDPFHFKVERDISALPDMPFNFGKDTKQSNIPWQDLNKHLVNAKTITELGCGTGWLCKRIKNNYPHLKVTGIDLSETAIQTAGANNNDITWQVKDILKYNKKADIIVSVGVLHHIPNHELQALMEKTINLANKYAFIGLYHKNSRQAMFDFFDRYPKHTHQKLFKKMVPHMTSDTQRASWFKDQFEHPYEVSSSLAMFKNTAVNTNTKLTYCNLDKDDTYNYTMDRLETYEFVSGFIYGGFKK